MNQKNQANLTMPIFENQLVNELYKYKYDIPPAILSQLLLLPNESLSSDLKKVLQDALERGDYYLNKKDVLEEEITFLSHAIFLSAEKQFVELLPDILNVLSADNDLLDFYLGDLITEVIWIALYKLCTENTLPLFEFFRKPNII